MPEPRSELRVFISSTFRDLQEEREHLIKKIFPEIRSLCRERGITFTEVDLRWGITDEEQRDGRVIGTCLDEVARCRPYFIGILGTRYGWVPTVADIAADAGLVETRPWLAEAVRDGLSLTAMEFSEGLLATGRTTSDGALVYRRSGNGPNLAEPGVEELVARTAAVGYRVQEFVDAPSLGALVRADLLALVERMDGSAEAASSAELERRAHAAFAASRAHGYVERPGLVERFEAWMRDGAAPLLVTGPSGLGKSSFIASLAASMRDSDQSAFVVEHYVGASDASTSVDGMIRHLLEAIGDGLELDEPVPESQQELENALQPWLYRLDHLARERGRTSVIFIDAVDQLEERGRSMAWLPERLPSTLRIVLSTGPGAVAEAVAARGCSTLDIGPLDDRGVREAIVARYLGGYHKRVARAELDRITRAPSAGSPLFLRVVSEELRLHGTHETIGEVVDRYAAAADVDELFTLVLERIERDYGRAPVRTTLGLLFAARNGLSEHELLEVSGLNRIELSRLLFAFDYHLIRRDALLGFFHDHLRRAVERRYLVTGATLVELHRQLGAYFAAQPPDARRRAEEPWQWRAAGERDRLAHALTDPGLFTLLNEPRVRHELIGYWRELAPDRDPVEEYREALDRVRHERTPAETRAAMIEGIADLHVASARFAPGEEMLREAYRYRRLTGGPDAPATIHAADLLATAMYHEGRYAECEELWQAALAGLERTLGSDDPSLCGILDSLTTCAYRRGDVGEMERYAQRSLELSKAAHGRNHTASIDRLINVAAVHLSRERFDSAILTLESAVRIARRAYGENHPTTAKCRTELGCALTNAGLFQQSVAILEQAALGTESLLGEHIALARVFESLGHAVVLAGDPVRAESIYRRAYRIRVTLQGEDHPDTMFARSRVAIAVRRSGRPEEAEEILRNLLPRQIEICGPRDENVLNTVFVLINVLRMTGRDVEAELWQRRYDAADVLIE